jgi:hypothetical protein
MRGAIPPLPQYAFMAWCLIKHRDNSTFTHDLLHVQYPNGQLEYGKGTVVPVINYVPHHEDTFNA